MKVMGFAGWSGSGKTTLVEQVIAALSARGLVVSLVKHAHHSFDIDHAGKDSWRHRQAGCREVMVSSDQRWSLTREREKSRSSCWKTSPNVIGSVRLMTMPSAPRSLCSHTSVTVWAKFGSSMAGMAIRNWLVR